MLKEALAVLKRSAIDAWVGYFLALPDHEREAWRKRIDFPKWKEAIDRMQFSLLHDVVLGIADPELTVSKVLRHRVDIDQRDSYGRTALFWACMRGDTAVLRELFRHGADARLADRKQYTPLHWLVWTGGSASSVSVLLEGGVDPNTTSMDHRTALHVAAQCREDRTEMMELLFRFRSDLEVHDAQGKTALHRAAEKGHAGHVRRLLRQGADVETRSGAGYTPLIAAVEYDSCHSVRSLVGHGARVDVMDNMGGNILHHAASWAGAEMMQMLTDLRMVGRGIDPSLRDRQGRSPWDCFELQRDQHYGAQHPRDVEQERHMFERLLASVVAGSSSMSTPEHTSTITAREQTRTSSKSSEVVGPRLSAVRRADTVALSKIPGSWNFAS